MKKLLFSFLYIVLFLGVPLGVVFASEIQTGKTVSIVPSHTLSENTYLVGEQVTVSAPSSKDLTVLGGTLIVNAPVAEDALLLGGTVSALEGIQGDARVAGGDIIISKSIGGDALILGGTVTVLPSASVGGDLIILGGTVTIEGTVHGKVTIYGGEVTLNALVDGPVSIQAGDLVTFGKGAVLKNTLTYSAPEKATVEDGAVLGDNVVFTALPHEKGFGKNFEEKDLKGIFFALFGFLVMLKFLGMLTAALAATFAFKTFSLRLSENVIQHFWKMTGIGFIALVAVPCAIILLAITLVGLYLGFILGALYLLTLLTAGVYMCIFAGAFLSKWIKKQAVVSWQWTIVGTLAVFIVALIPIIGWIVTMLLYFASVGVIIMSLKSNAQAKM